MSKNHIKILMVNEFVGTPCNDSTTANDLVETLLDRKEVPLIFSRLCGILYFDKKEGYLTLIPKNELVKKFKDQELHFRVLVMPTDEDLKLLAKRLPTETANFTDMLINQVHRLFVTNTWSTDEKTAMSLAGYKCGVEFGIYNRLKHPQGFLTQTIKQYLPERRLRKKDVKEQEEKILAKWYDFSEEKQLENHQDAVLNYLKFAAKNVALFGCTVIKTNINKIDGKKFDADAILGVRSDAVVLTLDDGEVIMEDEHQNVRIDFSGKTSFSITASGKTLECDGTGLEQYKQIIDFVKNAKVPTLQEVCEDLGINPNEDEEKDADDEDEDDASEKQSGDDNADEAGGEEEHEEED